MNRYYSNRSITSITVTLKLILPLVGLSGCGNSQLEVTVAVLNPDYLEKYKRSAPIEAVERQAKIASEAVDTEGVLGFKNINSIVKLIGEESAILDKLTRDANLVDPNSPPLAPQLMKHARDGFINAREFYISGIKSIEKARQLPRDELKTALDLYSKAHSEFKIGETTLVTTVNDVSVELENERQARVDNNRGSLISTEQAEAIENHFKSTLLAIRQSTEPAINTAYRINNAADLRGDPLLGYVLQAPQDHWNGLYNRAFACVKGSNSDIAIVMDDVDKFSVKGLRADSSSATKATFATLSRVIDLAAAVSGVPVSGLIPDTAPQSGEVAAEVQAERQRIVSRAQLRARAVAGRYEMVRLLDAVLVEGATTLDTTDGTGLDDPTRVRIQTRLKSLTN